MDWALLEMTPTARPQLFGLRSSFENAQQSNVKPIEIKL